MRILINESCSCWRVYPRSTKFVRLDGKWYHLHLFWTMQDAFLQNDADSYQPGTSLREKMRQKWESVACLLRTGPNSGLTSVNRVA